MSGGAPSPDDRVRFPFGESEEGRLEDLELDASDLAPIPPSLDTPRDRGLRPLDFTGGSSASRRAPLRDDVSAEGWGIDSADADADLGPLGQTAELELPPSPLERAALAEYERLFESAGDTPIVLAPSEDGAAPLPAEGPAPRPRPAGSAAARAAALTPVERLAGLWRGDALWILLSIGGALLGPLLLFAAWDYYGLPKAARPGHPWDRALGSGGGYGLLFGIAGSALFLLNLTYVLRRRLGVLRRWVSMRLWLNVHFVCGLTGGSLILLHSALSASNRVARISSAAIAAAIASGLFGRFVLAHLPRRAGGEAADRGELAVHLARLRAQLRQRLARHPELRAAATEALAGHRREALSQVSQADGRVDAEARLGLAFALPLLLEDVRAWRRNRALARRLRALVAEAGGGDALEELIEEVLELVRLHARVDRRLSQYAAAQDLMDTWRGLHMILALILVVTMGLHVVIVLTYSRLSVFGE